MSTFVEQIHLCQSNFYARDDVLIIPSKLAEQIQSQLSSQLAYDIIPLEKNALDKRSKFIQKRCS